MRSSLGVLVGVALVLSALPAAAHHGWGGNSDAVSEMTGVVVSPVSLSGPHGTMKIKTADGKTWDITLAPPFRTSSAGLKQDTLKVGNMVTVHGNKNRDANRFEMKTVQVDYEGKHFMVYPEREATLHR